MTSRLTDKKSKVIVVDPSGPVRQMMVDVVRNATGIENVEGRASVQDMLSSLEAENVDWVIMSLFADQPITALQVLKLAIEAPELRQMRISLCLEDDERYVLPAAFELGLLSWHAKPFTKDTLSEELKLLAQRVELEGGREPLIAAHYLRQWMKDAKNYRAQVDLDKALLDLFPGTTSLLLDLAEPQFHLGNKDEARKTLGQVKLLDAALADRADELVKTLFGAAAPTDAPADAAGATNILGIKKAVIVDSDDSVSKGVEDILKSLGVESVTRFSNGEDAWAHLDKEPEQDLLVMEWRIPKLSGPMLLQRIRHRTSAPMPVVVLSSLLKPDDMPLVKEIGVANIIQKPLMRDLFVPGIVWTMQQERLPTESQSIERKVRQLLKAGKKKEAEPLRFKILGDPNVGIGRKKLIDAEWAFASGDFNGARDAAVEALKHAGDSINVLNLLGKTFMRLKNYEASLKCFKKAQEFSPNNIERLCHMAEAHSEVGEKAQATEALDHATTIDPDNKVVPEAEARIAISTGDIEKARELLGESDASLENIVAYMNNKAVAYAKCGHLPEAIEVYRRTVASIPEDKRDTRAIVLYNFALAQIRASEFEAALECLKQIAAIKDGKIGIGKKAASLRERLGVAVQKGAEFKLNSADTEKPTEPAAASIEDAQRRIFAAVEVRRGDLCCHLVFNYAETQDQRTQALLAKAAPRFARRTAIARAEGLGADRMVKESA